MRTKALIATLLALTMVVGLAGVQIAGADGGVQVAKKARTKTVKVGDDFFSPKKLRVRKNTTIVWKWSRANGEAHDVLLGKRPKGVKRFHSAPAATDYTFKRKLRKAGTYKILCTFHEGMRQTIVVKR